MSSSSRSPLLQALVGLGAFALGCLMAWGAADIPSNAGYGGIGPNALPWLVSVVLMGCGVGLLVQALRGGFTYTGTPGGADRADLPAGAWVAAAVVVNATLIERVGFVLACALCFALAVRGLRLAQGKPGGRWSQALRDLLVGMAIALPVFWMFTKLLGIQLPGLTGTGWI
ncbi:tripartite tricarboxylate transporter TctB family protein [Roseateles sp. BYS180W]|uniref:Tripartite tricarboxylate transporter TctB family protein n=1 Tax=Roseateles rivi TaxID=3299028 RepID=A0ABW7FVP5_9BURK